jgi:hypothetical protein
MSEKTWDDYLRDRNAIINEFSKMDDTEFINLNGYGDSMQQLSTPDFPNFDKSEIEDKIPKLKSVDNSKKNLKPEIESILDNIEKLDINEDDLQDIKLKMKNLEKKIKEQNKPKTITISGKDHATIKKYCTIFNLNIGDWATKTLLEKIESDNCIISEDIDSVELFKRDSEALIEKYKPLKGTIIKTDFLLNGKDFNLLGYSKLDGKNIYILTGDYVKIFADLKSRNISFELSNLREVSTEIIPDTDKEINIEYFV